MTELADHRMVARWESRTGRWWATLHHYGERAYGYGGDGCGGVLYADSDDDAVSQVQDRVDKGLFQPDDNKTPMRRTF